MIKQSKASLLIKSKRKLFLNTAGEHTSLFKGDGLDFKEIRQYASGDDIRHINWKITAKKRVTNVNVFNENKQLNIVLVYLNSGSIYFGSQKSKQDTMIEVLTSLGYSAISKNDLLTTIFFSDNENKFYKASKNKKILDININTAYELNPLGENINYDKLSSYLLAKIKKKSLIFLIGDFLEIPNFKQLGKKHEVYCAIVRDKLEEDINFYGDFNFIDTSSYKNSSIYLDDSTILEYNKAMIKHDKHLFSSLQNSRIKYKKIYTHENSNKNLRLLVKS
jgi:uncharacterized protein (DUF58 family)